MTFFIDLVAKMVAGVFISGLETRAWLRRKALR